MQVWRNDVDFGPTGERAGDAEVILAVNASTTRFCPCRGITL